METAFSNLKPGDKGHVLGYSEGNTPYRSKLLAMGLVPGVPFRVVRNAPLGDPVEIQVNGFHLSLRKQEADLLRIEKEGA
ncbi:MAG TPA: FeoA family protein [SAR324 cluster bacterium]|jgi:ferrous iron transport protein A|nr:ferrous iron transport protein A [Deltaproteobacteria bacterium]MDP6091437.1 FeoA family protein [SAR324 cluster bacterium]MBP44247.1 ferrous iron transport protein A [Deltaproteobacteria bacterium]MDP6464927.1 FeoA family protein [SAR324 cluster bacterium]MDP6728936.1 FeoA family protein [SAR324 cluster bacterium]|tara:strand:+ start:622 stop:861 length:240 start_codon:yes stop_codon:yes gene_type:complete